MIPLTVALVLAGLSVYTWHQSKAGAKAFSLFTLSLFVWTFLAVPEYYSQTLTLRATFGKLQYMGIVFVPLTWLIFTLRYTQRDGGLKKYGLTALSIVPIISLVLAFTDRWHGLIWKDVNYTSLPFPQLIIEHGLWFRFILTPYIYGIFILGFFVLLTSFLLDLSLYRRQTGLTLLSAAFPLMASLLYLLSDVHFYGLDPTPYGFAACAVFNSYTLFLRDPLRITPVSYRQVFLNTTDSVFLLNQDHTIIDLNPTAIQELGLNAKEVLGKAFSNYYPDFQHLLDSHTPVQQQHSLELNQAAKLRYVELKITPLQHQNTQTGKVILLRDITLEREQQARLEHLVYQDSLTGVANRRQLQLEAERFFSLASRYGVSMSLLYIDLDKFKLINDNYGHEMGDEVLAYVANCLKQSMRENDIVARIGGDEFAVLLYEAGLSESTEARDRLETRLAKPFRLGKQTLSINASVGFALYPDQGQDLASLLRHADTDMYQVKRNKNS